MKKKKPTVKRKQTKKDIEAQMKKYGIKPITIPNRGTLEGSITISGSPTYSGPVIIKTKEQLDAGMIVYPEELSCWRPFVEYLIGTLIFIIVIILTFWSFS